jgi:hypothetical protein
MEKKGKSQEDRAWSKNRGRDKQGLAGQDRRNSGEDQARGRIQEGSKTNR